MKYTFKLETTVDIPSNSKYVLIYERKDGTTNVYPILEIINQNHRLLRANVLGKGIRSFITSRIITLDPVKHEYL